MDKIVARIQEEIKECRTDRKAFLWFMVGGLLFAASPIFFTLIVTVMAVLSDRTLPGSYPGFEFFVWSLPIGIAAAVGGIVGYLHYDHKLKKLIRELNE